VTRRFVEKILDELLQILLTQDIREPVTPLQEISQKRYGKTQRYVYAKVSGGYHDPMFRAEVYVNDEKVAEATARCLCTGFNPCFSGSASRIASTSRATGDLLLVTIQSSLKRDSH